MDFSSPGLLLSGLVVSLVGLGLFLHGRKAQNVKSLGVGIVMMGFPYFVHSILLMWVIAGVCAAGLYVLSRMG